MYCNLATTIAATIFILASYNIFVHILNIINIFNSIHDKRRKRCRIINAQILLDNGPMA